MKKQTLENICDWIGAITFALIFIFICLMVWFPENDVIRKIIATAFILFIGNLLFYRFAIYESNK